jgi:hypothetical protein
LRTFISWKGDKNNVLVKSYAKKDTAASIANSYSKQKTIFTVIHKNDYNQYD